MAKNAKLKELSPWDRRPWPTCGDTNQDTLYAAVGRALSEWERYDATLSFLYSSLVTTIQLLAARRSYSAVRTFEGRMEMLRAASEANFSEYPDAVQLTAWKVILRNSMKYCERRNEIAHGAVDHYQPEPPALTEFAALDTFALFPSYATFRTRELDGTPTYCYTEAELEYFRQEFFKLRRPVIDLSSALMRDTRRYTSPQSTARGLTPR
jgi:hypothetical protein